jgi:hypothetical protein
MMRNVWPSPGWHHCLRTPRKHLKIAGYSQSKLPPRFWTYTWYPISFSIVVDDFGMKYLNKDNVDHLLHVLKQNYLCNTNWEGTTLA